MQITIEQMNAVKRCIRELNNVDGRTAIIQHRESDTVASSHLYDMGGKAIYMDVLFSHTHLKRFAFTEAGDQHEHTLFNFEVTA